ncbi:hypothetical protein R6Q59_024148 [Mikania micrantha]
MLNGLMRRQKNLLNHIKNMSWRSMEITLVNTHYLITTHGYKQARKKGRFDISDPQVMMTGTQSTLGTSTYLHARNEEVQQLNEKIAQLQQEKEAERLEKEKKRPRNS